MIIYDNFGTIVISSPILMSTRNICFYGKISLNYNQSVPLFGFVILPVEVALLSPQKGLWALRAKICPLQKWFLYANCMAFFIQVYKIIVKKGTDPGDNPQS